MFFYRTKHRKGDLTMRGLREEFKLEGGGKARTCPLKSGHDSILEVIKSMKCKMLE
jgi:hypothetical protein